MKCRRVGTYSDTDAAPAARRPFTLVELLVVVAIIAILAAMLLPVLGRARSQAVMVSCLGRQKQAVTSLLLYGSDYEEYPTLTTWEDQCASRSQEGQASASGLFQSALLTDDYSEDPRIFQCTEASFKSGTNRFDHFTRAPWFRYNGPSAVGYWTWHYGHGNRFRYYGWHWYNWSNAPYSSSRGASWKRDTPPAGNFYEFQALLSCPRTIVCPSNWAYGYAYEAHLERPQSAFTPSQVQFAWNANVPHVRNYVFTDGHGESVTNR